MDQKVFEKIKKLLALSQSSNANEAASALDKAMALMEQNQVSMLDVKLSNIGEVVAGSANVRKQQPIWRNMLVNLVAKVFGVEPLIEKDLFEGKIKFIGTKDRIEIAGYCYVVLHRKIMAERKRYVESLSKRMKPKSKTIKADVFCRGWVTGVWDNVVQFANIAEHEKQLIEQYMGKNHQSAKLTAPKQDKGRRYLDALLDGLMAGGDVNIHHGVGGSETKRIGHAN